MLNKVVFKSRILISGGKGDHEVRSLSSHSSYPVFQLRLISTSSLAFAAKSLWLPWCCPISPEHSDSLQEDWVYMNPRYEGQCWGKGGIKMLWLPMKGEFRQWTLGLICFISEMNGLDEMISQDFRVKNIIMLWLACLLFVLWFWKLNSLKAAGTSSKIWYSVPRLTLEVQS